LDSSRGYHKFEPFPFSPPPFPVLICLYKTELTTIFAHLPAVSPFSLTDRSLFFLRFTFFAFCLTRLLYRSSVPCPAPRPLFHMHYFSGGPRPLAPGARFCPTSQLRSHGLEHSSASSILFPLRCPEFRRPPLHRCTLYPPNPSSPLAPLHFRRS